MNNETECVLCCRKKREVGDKDREKGEKERGERYKIKDTHTQRGDEIMTQTSLESNFISLFVYLKSHFQLEKVFYNIKSWFWELCTDNFIGWFCLRELSRRCSMGHLNSNTQAGLSFITWHWEVFSMVLSQCGALY